MDTEVGGSASREARLRELERSAPLSDVLDFYDSLPPVSVEAMIGSWRGSGIVTGHPFDGLLERFGWYGKRFRSKEDVDPLVFEEAKGNLFAINPSLMPTNFLVRHPGLAQNDAARKIFKVASGLVTTGKPQARLRMTEYRNVTTATMIYDSLPINDVFRFVSPKLVIGAMDIRGFAKPFMFVLRKV